MTNEATRLAEEAKRLVVAALNIAESTMPPFFGVTPGQQAICAALDAIDAIDALATLAQPAPTAEVALPAVSEADHPLHRCCDCPACTAYFADNPISNSDGAIYARSQTAAKDDAMASQEKPHD